MVVVALSRPAAVGGDFAADLCTVIAIGMLTSSG